MPKVKKPIRANALSSTNTKVNHDPLGQVIANDASRSKYAKQMRSVSSTYGASVLDDDDDINNQHVWDDKSSQKIIEMSKVQQMEIAAEEEQQQQRQRILEQQKVQQRRNKKNQEEDIDDSSSSSSDDGNDEEDDEEDEKYEDPYKVYRTDDGGYVTISEYGMDDTGALSAADEALIQSMMSGHQSNGGSIAERKTLSDMILEKIDEKTKSLQNNTGVSDAGGMTSSGASAALPPKVVEVYTDIGKLLSRYTSGKLPKAFKVIPSLSNWEEVLYLTRPDLWTPQAMYAATRIFASNLDPRRATKFFNLVLLDAVRNDIGHTKKLNYHYYIALKKAVYKPLSFFKGIIVALCTDETCTLREAAIVASVLQRVSIPSHHSAVAILKLCQQTPTTTANYSGVTSIFLKTLLNKKYSLPTVVVDTVVQYFGAFLNFKASSHSKNDDGTAGSSSSLLPVLWHQALLVFVQRYKDEINSSHEHREMMKALLKKQYHPKITYEIRRELFGNIQAFRDANNMISSANNHVIDDTGSTTMVITQDSNDSAVDRYGMMVTTRMET